MAQIPTGSASGPEPSGQHGTSDQLRHAVDSGRTGDKVDFPDPAAAPLGTDDEAAGHAPSRERIRAAFREEATEAPEGHFDGWPIAVMVGAGAAVAAAAIYAVI